MPRAERGIALVDVLIAVVILTAAGMSTISLLAAALRDQARLEDREKGLAHAERVLIATSLLTRRELDLRLGRRQVGALVVNVQRPEPTLYRLAVADTLALDVEQLVTVVYRPANPAPGQRDHE